MQQLPYTKINTADWAVGNNIKGHGTAPETKWNEGTLDVGDGHHLHYAQYGNPNGEPVMILHGGPGSGCNLIASKFFDPIHYRVIMLDQRGSGKSNPHISDNMQAALYANDTEHLIEDIEKLRRHLGIDQTHIFGGSWGSTLALAYAQAHPQHVKSLTVYGIFNASKQDIDFFYQGNAAEYDETQPENHTEKEGAYRAYLGDGTLPGSIPPAARDERMAAAYAKA